MGTEIARDMGFFLENVRETSKRIRSRWKQKTPRDQLVAILSNAEGHLLNGQMNKAAEAIQEAQTILALIDGQTVWPDE